MNTKKLTRDELSTRLADLGLEIDPEAWTSADLDQELARRADDLYELSEEYLARLPIVPISRCPFTDEPFWWTMDVEGLDGPFWDYRASLRPPTRWPSHHIALTGAMSLEDPKEDTEFLVVPGPGAPFVLPELLKRDDMRAVINQIPVGAHTGWAVHYYIEDPEVDELPRFNDWGTDRATVRGEDDGLGWDTVYEHEARLDFDLVSWLDSGKLLWIVPGDEKLRLRTGSTTCPYVGLTGERRFQRLRWGEM